jgi:hypothetical protein
MSDQKKDDIVTHREREQHSKYIYYYYYYYCFIQPHPLGGLFDMFDSMLHALIVNWSAKL